MGVMRKGPQSCSDFTFIHFYFCIFFADVLPLCFRCESTVQLQRVPNTDSFCLILPPNLKSAIAAVTYMAEQLKKQDTDDSVSVKQLVIHSASSS